MAEESQGVDAFAGCPRICHLLIEVRWFQVDRVRKLQGKEEILVREAGGTVRRYGEYD